MAILIFLWLIFSVSHSLLAATKVRAFFEELSNHKPYLFRLVYNSLALIILFSIVEKTIELNKLIPFFIEYFLFRVIGIIAVLGSFYVLFGVAKQMDLMAFFGFKNEEMSGELMTDGWYRVVRHPLYFGLFLLFLGVFCVFPTLGIAVSVAFSQLYVVIGIEFEERKLRRIFGQQYVDFSIGKKKFIPFIY
jgi:methanethiol S-methyltransferase